MEKYLSKTSRRNRIIFHLIRRNNTSISFISKLFKISRQRVHQIGNKQKVIYCNYRKLRCNSKQLRLIKDMDQLIYQKVQLEKDPYIKSILKALN